MAPEDNVNIHWRIKQIQVIDLLEISPSMSRVSKSQTGSRKPKVRWKALNRKGQPNSDFMITTTDDLLFMTSIVPRRIKF